MNPAPGFLCVFTCRVQFDQSMIHTIQWFGSVSVGVSMCLMSCLVFDSCLLVKKINIISVKSQRELRADDETFCPCDVCSKNTDISCPYHLKFSFSQWRQHRSSEMYKVLWICNIVLWSYTVFKACEMYSTDELIAVTNRTNEMNDWRFLNHVAAKACFYFTAM